MSNPLTPGERPTSPPAPPSADQASPPAPPGGPGGPGGPASGRWSTGVVVAVAAVLGALVVVAGLLIWSGRDDGEATSSETPGAPATPDGDEADDAAPDGPSPDRPDAGPSGEPDPDAVVPLACPTEVAAPICEAAEFVQRETGRAFHQFPVVELEEEGAFQARLLDTLEEDLPSIAAYGETLAALGLVPGDLDVIDALRDLYAVGVVGFYEPADDVLVVRGTELSPYTRTVIVHELVHALDDQWFDVDRPHYDENSELSFGFATLVEGHARYIDERYRASMSEQEQAESVQEELRLLLGSDIDLFSLPAVLIEQINAPYELGAPLVEDIIERGGLAALTAAFDDPPRSSEHVLHPDRYHAREPVIDVPTPPADGEIVEEDVLGEFALRQWLDGDEQAAEGWGGDRYVTWADGDGSCTRIDLAMDSSRDLAEVRAALESWAGNAPRRTIDDVTVADSPALRVTACTS